MLDLNNVIFEDGYLNCLLFKNYKQVCNMYRVATIENPATKGLVEAAEYFYGFVDVKCKAVAEANSIFDEFDE